MTRETRKRGAAELPKLGAVASDLLYAKREGGNAP
jgi:hypothetical protein